MGYLDYLQQLLPRVRPGGLILGHDMHPPIPDPRFLEAITYNPDLDTSFIMMESVGISMTLQKRCGTNCGRPASPSRSESCFPYSCRGNASRRLLSWIAFPS